MNKINELRTKLIHLTEKGIISTMSYVGSDEEVKARWGNDIDASKINQKLKDLDHYPHLYVLACLMDRQTKAENAWAIPYIICKRLCKNKFDFDSLRQLSERQIDNYFVENKLHRLGKTASDTFKSAINTIAIKYNGDASLIWKVSAFGDKYPSSSEVILNFLQFQGCGIKIATMATNILHRNFGIQYSDYYSLDISPDIHVRRVLYRLGLLEKWDDTESIIYRARTLNPDYPGIIDSICWLIGRQYCSPNQNANRPRCNDCKLNKYCKFNDDVNALNSQLTNSTVISIKKVSLTDIRPVLRIIHTSQIAYLDIRKLKGYKDLKDWITAHIESVLCIDNIDDLKFCDENFQASQLLFHLIRQEEYIDGETHIDFTNTKTIILYEDKREKEGYNFSNYASRSSIQFTL